MFLYFIKTLGFVYFGTLFIKEIIGVSLLHKNLTTGVQTVSHPGF